MMACRSRISYGMEQLQGTSQGDAGFYSRGHRSLNLLQLWCGISTAYVAGAGCRDRPASTTRPAHNLPELLLTELESYPFAEDENVRGGVVVGNDAFYWTSGGAWFASRTNGRREVRCPLPIIGILGAGMVGGRLLALDTSAQAIFDLNPKPSCRHLQDAHFQRLIAAVPTDSGWLLIRVDADSAKLFLWPHKTTAAQQRLLDWPAILSPTRNMEWFFLSSARKGAVFGNYRSAGNWALLNSAGKIIHASQGNDEAVHLSLTTKGDPAVQGVLWHALPPLELDRAFVRVLADLRSDRRKILLFHPSGYLVRSSEIVAPIGFFTSDVATSTLLGIRTSDRNELVKYGWRWGEVTRKEKI
jgi:hypothetical protein